jgi:hypothetical protein
MAKKKSAKNALVVRTFSFASFPPAEGGGIGPESAGTRPLEGVEIALKLGPDPQHLTLARDPQETGPDGQVRFEDIKATRDLEKVPDQQGQLQPVEYRIEILRATGFQPIVLFFQDIGPFQFGSDLITERINVREGGETVVDIGLAPELGLVKAVVKFAPELAPAARDNIEVQARNGVRLIDAEKTGHKDQFTDDDGNVIPATDVGECLLKIDEPGLIEIVPQSPVEVDGRRYEPKPEHASQFVLVPAGDRDSVKVEVVYEPVRAEILVGAQFIEEFDGREERRPLDGVTFRLFQQNQNENEEKPPRDEPIRELVTQPNVISSFSELESGFYRIVAVPPASGNGQRLQLTRPATPALSIHVDEGQTIDLTEAFEFRPVKGSLLGSVVVARDDTPLPGVPVVLSSLQQPQLVLPGVTNDQGEYEINGLSPGKYRVALQQAVVTALGARWEQEGDGDGDGSQTVDVRPRATSLVPEFRMVEEEHLITGQVLGPGGAGAPFVVVQVFDDPAAAGPIANVVTDQDGFYQFKAPTPGTFFIAVLERDGFASQRTPVTVNRPATAPVLFTSTRVPGAGGGGGGTSGGGSAATSDLNDFPFLTEEVDLGGRGAPAPPGGAGGAVGQTVERALREVLGWRPRASDPKGFQAALLQAFTAEEVAGHTEYHWNPRSYAVEIQADLGAVTGAQASLYARAKAAVDQVLPLLDGLTALRVDFDPENVSAIRAIVRSQLTELVKELGVEGGPRVQRVDQLFQFLLGDTLVAADPRARRDPDLVGGSLGILRERFGLQRFRINDIKEEETFSNFLIIVDHVVSLAESWDAQREFFVRGSTLVEPFFGTQLVLLSRDLEVVAESVHEVEFAMDSVFLGPSERQTLELRFPPGSASSAVLGTGGIVARTSPPMFVSELLSWVERFATEEGRQLIDEGGKQGVAVAFRPTILLLQALVHYARVQPAGAQDPTRMPDAYRRTRVQRALAELESQLAAAAARVEQIRAPNGPVTPPPPAPAPPAPGQPRSPESPRRRPPVPDRG